MSAKVSKIGKIAVFWQGQTKCAMVVQDTVGNDKYYGWLLIPPEGSQVGDPWYLESDEISSFEDGGGVVLKKDTEEEPIVGKTFYLNNEPVVVTRYDPGPPFYIKGVCRIKRPNGTEEAVMICYLQEEPCTQLTAQSCSF